MNILAVIGTAPNGDIQNLSKLMVNRCEDQSVDFMAAGIDAFKCPLPWEYVATGHYEDLPDISAYAKDHEVKGYKLIHYEPRPGVDIVVPRETWEGGSSALLGVMAGIKEGYRKIVLCGVPLEGPNPGHPGADYSMFQGKWTENVSVLCNYVRSMSGFTLKLLGNPDEVWLNG